ncbi:MAG: CopG family transcriptional regulator [Angustibacter sp.]
MGMKRTTVYVDEADLDVIKDAARRLGVSEAELLREGIRNVALANRRWAEPFFSQTFVPVVDEADPWDEQVAAYRESRTDS